jgi:hypothetical protein
MQQAYGIITPFACRSDSKLGAHKDWDRATELACEESFRPHWDIATQADTTAIRNLVVEACKP